MPIQRWRCPVVLRVKAVVLAVTGAAVALVFFPLWLAVPVTVLLGVWGLGMAAFGASVTLDTGAGLLRLRTGPVFQRIRLTDVTAVLVEANKVSVARARGGEVSLYAWRKGPLDALLGVPEVAGDIGHAISAAVALARAGVDQGGTDQGGTDQGGADQGGADQGAGARLGTPARTRSRLATALLGATGVVAIGCALVTRVHWANPALTVLGVVIALALGVSGLLYLLVALWILLTGRAPRASLTR
ncbi:MAG TPA: hypothetical protein VF838_12410 [Trebonia sp.]